MKLLIAGLVKPDPSIAQGPGWKPIITDYVMPNKNLGFSLVP